MSRTSHAGHPASGTLLFLVPIVGIVVWIIVAYHLAGSFGRGGGFTIGLVFLSWIFMLILGPGSDRYLRPAAHTAVTA